MFVRIPDTSAKLFLAGILSSDVSRKYHIGRVADGELVDIETAVNKDGGTHVPVVLYTGTAPKVIWTAMLPDARNGSVMRHRVQFSGPSIAVIGSSDRRSGKSLVQRVLVCLSAEQYDEAVTASQALSRAS